MEGPVADAASQRSAYRELLRSRNYRLWFSATFISSLGDWMGFVALQALVASGAFFQTGSRPALFALGGVMMARLAPSLLFGPVAGVLADRYDRRKLIVSTDVARFVLFVAVAFSGDLVALFALTFVIECLALLFVAAKDASLPAVVERRQLGEANQLNLLATYGTLPLGAIAATAIATLLTRLEVRTDPSRLVLLADAATYLVSAVLMWRLVLPAKPTVAGETGEGPGFVAELREGMAFIRDDPLIRALITGVAGVFFGAGIVVALGPLFVPVEFQGTSQRDWFTLMTTVGVGLVLGLGASVRVNRRFSKERVFPICLAATGAIASAMALAPAGRFPIVLALGVLLGAAAGLGFVQGYTLIHEHTEDETRARTFAALYTSTRVALFAALGLGPFVAGTIGIVGILIAGRFRTFSGIRATILAGGLVALFFGVSATRGMYRALREQPDRAVRLPSKPPDDKRGLFIVFEGVEGSGKSTQVRRLSSALRQQGYHVLTTREPGGPPIAEQLRAVLLDPGGEGMDGRTEALLLAAARVEHVEKVIRPELHLGTIVVCDRFIDSSLAYQGHGRGLGSDAIAEINRWAVEGLMPDVVVLLRLDPEEGLRRTQGRGASRPDRMEAEALDFHRRVAEGYLQLARAEPQRFLVVDASGDEASVAKEIRARLDAWLPQPQEKAASR
ncbi:MAG: dTMP kinase [Egibacteraceae bacterium]